MGDIRKGKKKTIGVGKKDKVDIKGHLKNLIVGIWSEGERTIPREKREMGVKNTNMTEKNYRRTYYFNFT